MMDPARMRPGAADAATPFASLSDDLLRYIVKHDGAALRALRATSTALRLACFSPAEKALLLAMRAELLGRGASGAAPALRAILRALHAGVRAYVAAAGAELAAIAAAAGADVVLQVRYAELPRAATAWREFDAHRAAGGSLRVELVHVGDLRYAAIQHVVVPAFVAAICDDAFTRCTRLKSVRFEAGSSLDGVGAEAFHGCDALESIALPASVLSIGARAFWGCYELKVVDLPAALEHIGDAAFAWCGQLRGLRMPESLARIGESAFHGCRSLALCEFGAAHAGELSLQASAFEGCDSLRAVVLPASLRFIPEGAFACCGRLERVTFAEASVLAGIGAEAFIRCTALARIALPASLRYIGAWAFDGCTRLASVTFAEGRAPATIGENAFRGCAIPRQP